MAREMKVLAGLGILIIVLAIPLIVSAGTVGNPASVDTLKGPGVFNLKGSKNIPIETGVDVEILFNRDIKCAKSESAKFDGGQWYMAKIGYKMFDRIEPYVKLGVARLETKYTATEMSSKEVKLESDTGFAWGAGAKVLLWDFQQPKIKLISDGFYRVADLDVDKAKLDGATVSNMDKSRSKFFMTEWQIALLASTEIDMANSDMGISKVVPYGGIKYSNVSGQLKMITTAGSEYRTGPIESKDKVGVIIGTDLVGKNDSFSLNLEGRFVDETAMTVGLSMLF